MTKQSQYHTLLPKRVLVDTCFLISLVKEKDSFHKNAKDYFEALLDSESILLLSAIVWAEFSERQKIFEIFENFQFRPFGFYEAEKIHDIKDSKYIKSFKTELRTAPKDDAKILSHYFTEKAEAVITSDEDFISYTQKHDIPIIDFKIPLSQFLGQFDFES